MRKKRYYYTINFTLSKYQTPLYHEQIRAALQKIQLSLALASEIKVAMYVDILMMSFMRKNYPETYKVIYEELTKLYKQGVSMEFYLNLEWENTDDIHSLDIEHILDVFAIAKYILSPFNKKNQKTQSESVQAIRIMNSKVQPFSHLLKAYQFIGIKLDASTLHGLRCAPYYDYSRITSLVPYRFSTDPNVVERFGSFIAVPRTHVRKQFGILYKMRSIIQKLGKKENEIVKTFFLEKKVEFSPIQVFHQASRYILNPDVLSSKKLDEYIGILNFGEAGSIISIESDFRNINHLSFQNVVYLGQEKNAEFVSTDDIIQEHLVTNNKFFK